MPDKLTLNTEKRSGSMTVRILSMISKLDIFLPVIFDGNATDTLSLATGLRYSECGKYSGRQSDTSSIVCIFIIVIFSFFVFNFQTIIC